MASLKMFYRSILLLTSMTTLALTTSVRAGLPDVLAYDNGDLYPGNPDHGWASNFNGGFGYGAWTPLSDTAGGGTYNVHGRRYRK